MEKIISANGPHKETYTAKMILYKNMKATVHLPGGDTDFFEIVAGDP